MLVFVDCGDCFGDYWQQIGYGVDDFVWVEWVFFDFCLIVDVCEDQYCVQVCFDVGDDVGVYVVVDYFGFF